MSSFSALDCRAPDLCVPVVGFRQWRLAGESLASPYTGTIWRRAELRATCNAGCHDPVDTPATRCTCGIYALYEACPRMAAAATLDLVSGVVVVWGHLEAHASGLRGSHARIVGLELPMSHGRKRRRVAAIAKRLDVPLVPHGELRAIAATYGLPLPPSLRPARSNPTVPRRRRPRWRPEQMAIRLQ